jgi:hypothetical protein
MLRVVAALVVVLGALTLAWGVWMLENPPELGYGFGVVLVVFGLTALYSGASVLRSGRL